MQEEIGHAQHVRQVLLLNPRKVFLNEMLVGFGLRLFAQMLDSAYEKAASAAGRIEDGFAKPRIDLLDDELSDRTRRIELAGVPGGL